MIITGSILISTMSQSSIVNQNPKSVQIQYERTFTIAFSDQDIWFSTQQEYDVVHLYESGYQDEPGKPMLPLKTIQIALPEDMKATQIMITDIQQHPLAGTYQLYPSQPAAQIGASTDKHQFIQPDPKIYRSNKTYPTKFIELTDQNDLAGQGIAQVTLYPLQYIPFQKKLFLVTSLTFTIKGISGYLCNDYLSNQVSKNGQELLEHVIQSMVINPEDVEVQSNPIAQPSGVDPGNYEYVIITQDSWVSAFQPLADWKTQKGVPATIVTTSWIYNNGGYSGSNVEKIKAFVQDVYSNWGTLYILLGGDIDVVPCHYRTFSSVDPDPVPNDTYYADFDGDWVCEVHVGRASVTGTGTGTGKIGNFIDKILSYEKEPSLTDFAKNTGFFGFDLDSATYAEQCKINIDNTYVPSNWSMTTVYDSQGGNHKTNVIAALNEGQNLMNHADHSGTDFMGTGYVNHGIGLWNSDMDGLTNINKQGILYSMGCDPAAYDISNCIGEHFVRNSNGGGVAFIGNSRYGWYYQGQYNSLSMGYDMEFFESIFQDNLHNLGVAFSDHKNDEVGSSSVSKYCYTELTLLGDPELPIWKENPINMTVEYPPQVPVDISSFTILVLSGGNPVTQAYVCLYKESDVYITATTNSTGQATFTIQPTTTGTMYITATKQNFLPFEAQIMVINETNSPPQTPNKPQGPENGEINQEYSYSTNTTDPDYDQIWYQWSFDSYITDWLGPYASGASSQVKYTWPTPGTYEVKVKAKDHNGLESNWSLALTVTIVELKPLLELGSINSGLFTITTEIRNIGEIAATNINWEMTVDGSFILSGTSSKGTIASMDVGNRITIKNSPLFGFGNVIMTVTVNADGLAPVTKTVNGFLFFVYVIL